MRTILAISGLALTLAAIAAAQVPQKSLSGGSSAKPDAATVAASPASSATAQSQDETAIRLAAEAFVKA